jgi:hypothetical protein
VDKHYTVEELIGLCEKHKIRKLRAGPNEIEMDPSAFVVDGKQPDKLEFTPKNDDDFLALGIAPEMRGGLKELLPNLTMPEDKQ